MCHRVCYPARVLRLPYLRRIEAKFDRDTYAEAIYIITIYLVIKSRKIKINKNSQGQLECSDLRGSRNFKIRCENLYVWYSLVTKHNFTTLCRDRVQINV